ncbi:MAG: alpha/beta hydrolase, partial [Bryobacteraceae bacterium]
MLLLHGGLNSIQTSFAKQIAIFAKKHRVIAIDQMAHGRTADVPGRGLSYEQMAEDTAALMVHLGIRDADVVGWSDGGQLALRLAFTHPELIRRVVASGVSFGPTPVQLRNLADDNWWDKFANGAYPEGRAEYNRVSPDGPEHWKLFLEKVRSM